VAVQAFLDEQIGFRQIDRVIAHVIETVPHGAAQHRGRDGAGPPGPRGTRLYRAQAGRMTLITTLLAFIVALGSLITLHELGHYLVARGAA
jgi:hypothetical protein